MNAKRNQMLTIVLASISLMAAALFIGLGARRIPTVSAGGGQIRTQIVEQPSSPLVSISFSCEGIRPDGKLGCISVYRNTDDKAIVAAEARVTSLDRNGKRISSHSQAFSGNLPGPAGRRFDRGSDLVFDRLVAADVSATVTSEIVFVLFSDGTVWGDSESSTLQSFRDNNYGAETLIRVLQQANAEGRLESFLCDLRVTCLESVKQ